MRFAISAILVFLTVTAIPACAFGTEANSADQQSINELAAKVMQAPPGEQCLLYAELVHQMSEFSARQYAAGNVDEATGLLKQVQEFTRKIHLSVASNHKRLKNTEIQLQHAAFRLAGLLHSSSVEDRPLVAETLEQVNQVQTEAMMRVISK
jgi:hypothetical protein